MFEYMNNRALFIANFVININEGLVPMVLLH